MYLFAGGDDEGTRRRRPGEPLAVLDGWVWRAGGAAPAAQAGGARPQADGRAPAHRVTAAAPARGRARAQRLRGGAAASARRRAAALGRAPAAQAGDDAAGRRGRQAARRRATGRLDRVRDLRALPLRAVRPPQAAALALAVRLVPVQRRGVRRLRVVHVLRESAVLPLRERRGGGGRAVRVRAAAGVRGRAGRAAAVPVPVLAAAGLRGGGAGAVRALPPVRLPLPGASAAALQYYLVPPRAARASEAPSSGAAALYKYLFASGELRTARGWTQWSLCLMRVVCGGAGPASDESPASTSESSTSTL